GLEALADSSAPRRPQCAAECYRLIRWPRRHPPPQGGGNASGIASRTGESPNRIHHLARMSPRFAADGRSSAAAALFSPFHPEDDAEARLAAHHALVGFLGPLQRIDLVHRGDLVAQTEAQRIFRIPSDS